MSKYNIKIENIIKRYFNKDIFVETDNPINLVGKIINDNCVGKKFAIWGGGEHTENLYKYFSVELKEALFIIDNNIELEGKTKLGFKIVNPNKIKDYDIDVILISSYAGSKAIEEQIKSLKLNCKYVNFYEEFKKKGMKLEGAFFANPGIYITLFNEKRKYKICYNSKEKVKKLKKIIYLYLQIRDFYNARKYIKEYIRFDLDDKMKFSELLKDIDQVLKSLSDNLKKRHGKDIMLLFLDSLRAKDIYDSNPKMKYLNSMLKDSIYFTNAYSPSIFTYESVPSMFKNSMPFIDCLYKRKSIREDECEFLKIAKNKGYRVRIYALSHWKIIDGDNIEYGKESNYASETLWNAYCDMVESKEKDTIFLLYFWQEIHPPHIGGEHEAYPQSHVTPFTCNDELKQTQQEYSKQYDESLSYVDGQLKFYFDVMSKETIKIIFSDHGQIIDKALSPIEEIKTLAGWHTIRYHVPFIINGGNLKSKVITELFSTKNLTEILEGILNDKLNISTSEIIEVNFSKINNSIIIDKYKEKGYEDYLYGFKIFLSKNHKVVITGNNKIKIYNMDDEINELSNDEKLKDIICYFKQNNCDFNMPKFDYR
ncbi:sulfatase-like hydrolase/transferase [Clostridium botulinum]|uniref:sulfatase-like hydrolase/transferase n=1 Tax=Clostridium botulinum TaxID=1491 RepID=UPI0006A46226|nr:sulfatase-like hydrolase/transferase [Clostridium botulinum]KOC31912.1 hypothetical protein ADU81_12690 [Clostridium botulinum]